MTPEAAVIELLDRVAALQGSLALLTADELSQWPSKAITVMKAQQLITRTSPASSAECPGCEEACVRPVHTLSAPSESLKPLSFIVCDKRNDIARVTVPAAHLEQWQVSGDSIARVLADMLDLQRPTMGGSSKGRWEIGLFRGAKHASHLVLLAGETLILTLAGHSVALAEVLALKGNNFEMDKRRLTRLVDRPAAGAGDMESAEQRKARIKKRVDELKTQGVKAFLKTVAEEEGVSISRIKQILSNKSAVPADDDNPALNW